MGIRQTFGLFLGPFSLETGIPVATNTLAITLHNLAWGFTQPSVVADPKPSHLRRGRDMFDVHEGDLTAEDARQLLALHLAKMHENSPPESVFALNLSGLVSPEVIVFTAHRDGRLASVGALRMLAEGSAEVKSMRTHPDFLRMGAASRVLEAIIAEAARRGITRLSLETGSGPTFKPALALYRRRDFRDGAPFSPYEQTAFNQFLHLILV